MTNHIKVISFPSPAHWTFRDYIEGGINRIEQWHAELSEEAQDKFHSLLKNTRKIPNHLHWGGFKFLQAEAKKERLWQLDFIADKKQYRILGVFGLGQKQAALILGSIIKAPSIHQETLFKLPVNALRPFGKERREHMRDRSARISNLLASIDSRASYIRSKLSILVPSQIRSLRLKSNMPRQSDLAAEAKMHQSRISMFETPGAANLTLDTLSRLAAAFKVGLVVKFVPFSEMLRWENDYSQDSFDVTRIDHDIEFINPTAGSVPNALVAVASVTAVPATNGSQTIKPPVAIATLFEGDIASSQHQGATSGGSPNGRKQAAA